MKNLLLFNVLLVFWSCTSQELVEVSSEASQVSSILENNKVLNLNSETVSKSLVELVGLIKKTDSRYEFNVSKKRHYG